MGRTRHPDRQGGLVPDLIPALARFRNSARARSLLSATDTGYAACYAAAVELDPGDLPDELEDEVAADVEDEDEEDEPDDPPSDFAPLEPEPELELDDPESDFAADGALELEELLRLSVR